MDTPHHAVVTSAGSAAQPPESDAPISDPRCIVCQAPTDGSYAGRFPVCYDCYAGGAFAEYLATLEDGDATGNSNEKPTAPPQELQTDRADSRAHGASWRCEVTGRPIPLHDCLECAEHRRVPACPFPATVLKALANSMKSDDGLLEAQALARRAGVALLRVTGLLGCVRQAWYALRSPAPLQKPSEHWARLRGTIFHAALESLAGEPALAEQRLIASLEELGARAWIAGKIDHYDPALRLVTDYKTINTFGKRMAALDLPRQHHVAQLWIYGWLLAKCGHPYPAAGRIVYMDMGAVRTVDVPMPDAELRAAVEARLVEKAQWITEAGPDGPPGDPQEAWQCSYCAFAAGCPFQLRPGPPQGASAGK